MSSCPAISVSERSAALAGKQPGRLGGGLGQRVIGAAAVGLSCRRAAFGMAYRLALAIVSSVWVLLACKAVIGLVAAFDTYLTIKYAVSLDVYEQNPLGRWLMGLDQGPICETQQIAAFITAKFVGTLLVMIAIQGLAYWRVRVAGLVALPLAIGQLVLVSHLILGDG